jgi:hypothetical protein
MSLHKYPRTYHVPWSPGTSSDDRILPNTNHFKGLEIIVSEKLDGENTSMYSDHIHARSLDSKHHPSRNHVKALHGRIAHEIPPGWRICGENTYALHSIHYRSLTSYFYVFAIYDDKNQCLSWDETVDYANMLGLVTVPVLYRGIWDEQIVRACWTGVSTASPSDGQEGYVVRIAKDFPYDAQDEGLFSKFTAKYVRKGHVQTSQHWMEQEVVPNLLRDL